MIGEATYRFEHTGNQYRITTVGQARGLAALLIRGQGRIESHGLITRTGLQPQEFSVERGSRERREVATFDWESGIVTLHEQKTAPLELDDLRPAGADVAVLLLAARRRPAVVQHRHHPPRVPLHGHARVAARRSTGRRARSTPRCGIAASDDGTTDSYVWLAPSLHYVPVKLRLVATNRGTVEAVLDSIRIDEPLAAQ